MIRIRFLGRFVRSCWRIGPLAFPLFLLLPFLLTGPALASNGQVQHRLSLGGGVFTPLDGDHRSVFGSGLELTAEYAVSLSQANTWLFLECGWVRSSGQTLPDDPVFETDEETYTVVPLGLGFRFGGDGDHPVQVGVGLSGQWLYSRLSGPFGAEESQWGVAVAFDVRPEIRLSDAWGLWFRERIRVSSDFTYEDVGNESLGYQGAIFQAGVTARFGSGR